MATIQDTQISLRITTSDLERLKQLAAADERSVGYLVRKAIREYLDRAD